MSNTAHPASSEGPAREASIWLARLERGLREEEGQSLREWLKQPANRNVIVETARVWHGPDVNSVLSALVPPPPRRPESRARKQIRLGLIRTGVMMGAVALSILLLSGHMPWTYFDGSRKAAPPADKTYATGIGETREVKLADGTTITLNTGTRVGVTYSPRVREVFLAQGEATFNVAPESARPFNVGAGLRRFEAVGTRFNLRQVSPENVELIVTEGTVKVLDAPPRLPQTPARRRDPITYGEAMVGASEAALVEPGFQSVSRIAPREVEERLAWQRGMIIVQDRALEDVLAEVERYTPAKFVLADEKLRNLRISGHFRTGNVNSVRRALRQNFFVSSKRNEQGHIVLMALAPH